ncbi:MAG: DUF4180 domain-containing protein [Lachnospirales bacterium]
MKYELLGVNKDIANIVSDDILIYDVNSALDFVMSLQYECNTNMFIINKKNIVEEFFDLKTTLAGEILQKFVNYNVKIAIIGDYSIYTSKSLHDYIFECNKGKDIFFLSEVSIAVRKFES